MAKKDSKDLENTPVNDVAAENTEEAKGTRITKKAEFEQNVNDERMTEMLLDLVMEKDAFKTKYGFDKTTAVITVPEDLKETYPESKLRTLISESNAQNIYVTGKRIPDAKEIRVRVTPEVYEEYKEFMDGYKDTMRGEIMSEILHRGLKDILARKRNGEKVIRIPAVPEQEI